MLLRKSIEQHQESSLCWRDSAELDPRRVGSAHRRVRLYSGAEPGSCVRCDKAPPASRLYIVAFGIILKASQPFECYISADSFCSDVALLAEPDPSSRVPDK